MLVHITETRRVESIKRHGLLPPAGVALLGLAPVFGSTGSNRDVVQLLDFAGEGSRVIVPVVMDLVDGAGIHGGGVAPAGLVVLALDDALRSDPAFISHDRVKYRSRPIDGPDPRFRYVPWSEAWFERTIPWSQIREAVELREFVAGAKKRGAG